FSIFTQYEIPRDADLDTRLALGQAALEEAKALVQSQIEASEEAPAAEPAPAKKAAAKKAAAKRPAKVAPVRAVKNEPAEDEPMTTEEVAEAFDAEVVVPDTPPFDPETRDRDERRANKEWAI